MQTLIDAVSEALVSKLLASKNFMSTLADKLLANGALDCLKQSAYEASAMDSSRTYTTVTAMEGKLFHGVLETGTSTSESVITLGKDKLDVNVSPELIDRSHRLGQRHVGPSGEYKPWSIIVKFWSYKTRRSVFSAKCRLMVMKFVITENLMRSRNDLLKKVQSLDTVSCVWTTDGESCA